MRPTLAALVLLLSAVFVAAQPARPAIPPAGDATPAAKAAPRAAVRFPDFPGPRPTPAPVPPRPAADPDAPVKLSKGQFYVVTSPKPLLVLADGPGSVAVQERKPPFMLPAGQAPGWPADKADPDFVTWTDPYIYAAKGVKAGAVALTVVPALNDTDAAGKQVPLKRADVLRKSLLVDDGTVDPTPPAPTPPMPPPVADPLTLALRAAYAGDPDPDKARLVPVLADVLGGVVAAARASGTVTKTTELEAVVHRAADFAVGKGRVAGVRLAVGAYLATTELPRPGAEAAPMTDAIWATAAAEYAKVSAAIKGVK